jgi:hypothetical protein
MGNEAAGRTHISGEALSSVSPYTIELNVGKKGKGFEKIAKSAAKRYGSEEAGKKVAGSILKKVIEK